MTSSLVSYKYFGKQWPGCRNCTFITICVNSNKLGYLSGDNFYFHFKNSINNEFINYMAGEAIYDKSKYG